MESSHFYAFGSPCCILQNVVLRFFLFRPPNAKYLLPNIYPPPQNLYLFFLFFLDGIEPFFGRQVSMTPLQNVVLRFLI